MIVHSVCAFIPEGELPSEPRIPVEFEGRRRSLASFGRALGDHLHDGTQCGTILGAGSRVQMGPMNGVP
jgi:hypothetical protein